MPNQSLTVARGLIRRGSPDTRQPRQRADFFEEIGVKYTTFRSAADKLGAHQARPGLKFFDSSIDNTIAFGPGAGLAVGVSVGARSLRAVLVDANSWDYFHEDLESMPGQLEAEPAVLLERIKQAVRQVLDQAFDDERLLVKGALPLLGWAVAWPDLIDREKHPAGVGLTHRGWLIGGKPLDDRVRDELGDHKLVSYAMPDGQAAAIGVARRETQDRDHHTWRHPMLTMVVRLAGNVSGGLIVIEPDTESEPGFVKSMLIAGVDNHAGQIAHLPVAPVLIDELNQNRPTGLRPISALRCKCTPPDEDNPSHLESYVSVAAVTQRVHPKLPTGQALDSIVSEQRSAVETRALEDVGALLAGALSGPVTALNPASIVLTGSLALPPVENELRKRLKSDHRFGRALNVTTVPKSDNDFIRAKGAALAVIRRELYRNLPKLLASDAGAAAKIRALTTRFPENPVR